jgi:hypothetical protein
MKKILVSVVTCYMLVFVGLAEAVIINFDDLPGGTALSNYAGLTWGSSTIDSYNGNSSWFEVYDSAAYSTPHSGSNYVFPTWGGDLLYFEFASAVTFNGAWFATVVNTLGSADEVRFRDNLGNVSAWLDISATPQYLMADFIGSETIFIERQGGPNTAQWYSMDDVTYNSTAVVPEPTTFILLGSGFAGLAFVARRRKKG